MDESAEDRAFREHREGVEQRQAELSGLVSSNPPALNAVDAPLPGL